MNPQQEATALWRYIESRGHKPTHRAIASLLRSWGLKFRDGDLALWLAPFRETAGKHSGNGSETSGQQESSTRATSGQHTGNDPETVGLLLRAQNKVSLVEQAVTTDDSLRSSSSAQQAAPAKQQAKAMRLPLDAQVQIAKRAILDAIWPLLEPSLGRSITKSGWVKQNANVARELASLGRTPDEVAAAWHRASDRLGSSCRMLRIVQDELARMDSGETGGDCGCGLGRNECDRLHAQHNTTTDALPTVADLDAACNL